MAGTWPTFRAALAAKLEGVSWQVEDQAAETLSGFEYTPPGRQEVSLLPYAYLLPFTPEITRVAGGQRLIAGEVTVRVMLGGPDDDLEAVHQRYDGAWLAIADALDDFVAGDLTADYSHDQTFGPLVRFEDIDHGWGFELSIGVRISETRTLSA